MVVNDQFPLIFDVCGNSIGYFFSCCCFFLFVVPFDAKQFCFPFILSVFHASSWSIRALAHSSNQQHSFAHARSQSGSSTRNAWTVFKIVCRFATTLIGLEKCKPSTI